MIDDIHKTCHGATGQEKLLKGLVQQQRSGRMALVERQMADAGYKTTNLLQSQDEEECFVHFYELGAA